MRVLQFARVRRLALAVAASLIAVGVTAPLVAMGAVGSPAAPPTPPDGSSNFRFQTLNNTNDLTFNQLLGINNAGRISGYFGSGATGHPNKGYLLAPPYTHQSDYTNLNFRAPLRRR